MRSFRRASITTFFLTVALAGCGPAAERPSAAAQPGDPVTVDDCGRMVTVERPPERIVSLNQGSTEMLLRLGVADRVVGTAGWTDPIQPTLEVENAGVPRLADQAPSYEAVLNAQPDLVTASFPDTLGPGGVTTPQELDRLGVPSYVSAVECTKEAGSSDGARSETLELDAVFQEIRDLATLVDRRDEGDAIIAEMQDRVARLSTAKAADGTTAMYWFANAESPYLAGCCGGPGIISRTLGLTNAFDDAREDWPQIGWETVAQRNPDVLILGDLTRKSQTAENAAAKIAFLESNPVTREMTAVKNKRFVTLAGAELNPSIRIVDAMEAVADGLRRHGLTR